MKLYKVNLPIIIAVQYHNQSLNTQNHW